MEDESIINLLLMLATGILYIEVSGRITDNLVARHIERHNEPVDDLARMVLFALWPLLFVLACLKSLYNLTR
jgi:TRAP-type C4-dicarboxylate transport system permease small subunit